MDSEKDQSGYDGEVSNFDKTGNDVSNMQTDDTVAIAIVDDKTENVEDTKENDDGLVAGFKVLTERIKLV